MSPPNIVLQWTKKWRAASADNDATRQPCHHPAKTIDRAQGAALFPGLRCHMKKSPVLDVRRLLRAGGEPRSIIRARLDALEAGASFTVITPFLPSPLIELARSQDLDVQTAHRPDGAWETRITRIA